ncbi:MAG: ABC transporter ATP-binding protein, partial [Deltaproteobacteria bacterium]
MSNILKVEKLAKSFGGVKAVDKVSFTLERGSLLAMIGPNGAGKSTCFNLINGQLRPDSGRVNIMGKSTHGKKPRDVWNLGVGRTFQIAATFGSMTVLENVQMAKLSYHRKTTSLLKPVPKMDSS